MITFTHVSKRFGRFVALDDLNLIVAPHQAVALWGPNGAGKTTAIKCLLGLLRYDGHIDVDGLDAQKQGRSVRGRLGYVPQELAFYDDLSTLETAHFYARLKRAPEKRIVELLELVELSDHGDKAVGALSGGMKQRLALALALLADPPILVLDEPTSNLDAGARDDFLHLLKRVKAAGKTVIFTSHRLEEVEMLADEVLVLAAGKVEHRCTPTQLPQTVGLRRQIKLQIPALVLEDAITTLTGKGYQVHRNGTGLLVDVAPGAKAAPIHALSEADIAVTDFEVE